MPVMQTREVCGYTTPDKVQTRRSIARMEVAKLLPREVDSADRRDHLIQLMPAGRAWYQQLFPKVKGQ